MREREAAAGNVAVVAHDGIIRLFLCNVLGIPVWERFGMKVEPGGITELDWDARRGRWNLVRFNQAAG
jgi:broad specificity phosphatase PhoE